jgi:hypothetical protein
MLEYSFFLSMCIIGLYPMYNVYLKIHKQYIDICLDNHILREKCLQLEHLYKKMNNRITNIENKLNIIQVDKNTSPILFMDDKNTSPVLFIDYGADVNVNTNTLDDKEDEDLEIVEILDKPTASWMEMLHNSLTYK